MQNQAYHEPPSPASPSRLAYRKNEAAKLLGISARTLERLIARGVIKPDVTVGRMKLFSHVSLVHWLERGGVK